MKTLEIIIRGTCGHTQTREVPEGRYTLATQNVVRQSPMPCANCLRAQGHKMTDAQRAKYDAYMERRG